MSGIKHVDTLETLVELIDGWNDACEDGDRGRCNDALCLYIFDDGSGMIGTSNSHYDVRDFNEQFKFKNIEELATWLAEWSE